MDNPNNQIYDIMKNHHCEICDKEFLAKSGLRQHINSVHNGQKDHKCDSCGKIFSEAGTLKKHINAVHN